jgi:hypothetical protein
VVFASRVGSSYSQEASVNKPQNINNHVHNKRHSWHSTSSLIEVHRSFRKSFSAQPQRILRPISAIGICNTSSFPSALFTLGEKGISSRVYKHILKTPPSFTLSPANPIEPSPTNMAMTPGKDKQALPSSKLLNIINNEKPSTFSDWRLSLHEVKILYLKRQWKECKSRCDWLLEDNPASVRLNKPACLSLLTGPFVQPHAVHLCYIQFYAALCDELVAVSMHKYSNAKLPLLESSKAAYAAALKTLPGCGNVHFDDNENLSEEDLSFVTEITLQQPTSTPTLTKHLPAPPSPPWSVSSLPTLSPTEGSSTPTRSDSPSPGLDNYPLQVSPAFLQPATPLRQPELWSSISWTTDTGFDSPIQRPSPLNPVQSDHSFLFPERSTSLPWVPPSISWTTDVGFDSPIHLPSPLRPLHPPSEFETFHGDLHLPESASWTTNFTSSPVHRPSPLHVRSESTETITPTKRGRKALFHVRSDSTETVTPIKQASASHFMPSLTSTPQTPPHSPKFDEQVSPRSLTPTPVPIDQGTPRPSSPTPATFTMSTRTNTSVWMLDQAQRRFDALVAELAPMLERHIEAINMMIEDAVEAKTHRYVSTNVDSGDEEKNRIARQVRIAKLKARGWKRERFNPQRYQELCAKALAEL